MNGQKKNLQKLSRLELLELLLAQTRETEQLRERLEQAEAALQDRNLKVEKAGDLAQAVLVVNEVMETAQKAAQQYLENIEQMKRDTERSCKDMLAQARLEAEQIRMDAIREADPVHSAQVFKGLSTERTISKFEENYGTDPTT